MKESELYFNFLVHIISADGQVKDEEAYFIQRSMEEVGIQGDIREKIDSQIQQVKNGKRLDNLDEIIEGVGLCDNPYFILNLLKDGIGMAACDSELDDTEAAVIKRVIALFSPDPDKSFGDIMNWANRTIALEQEGLQLLEAMTEGN